MKLYYLNKLTNEICNTYDGEKIRKWYSNGVTDKDIIMVYRRNGKWIEF